MFTYFEYLFDPYIPLFWTAGEIYLLPCLLACLLTYIPTYLLACLLTYLHIYLLSCLLACLLTYIPTYLLAWLLKNEGEHYKKKSE